MNINKNANKYSDYSNNPVMHRLYLIFILASGESYTNISCLDNINNKLSFMYDEGYILLGKALVFLSKKTISELKEVLEDIPKDHSYILLDISDNITDTMSAFQIEKVFKKNQVLKTKFDNLIKKFQKPVETNVKENSQTKIDKILDKISKTGISSLTIHEKDFLDNNSVIQ